MAYSSNILLGRITKVSGYEGAVAVKLEKSFTENIPRLESVFLEIDGRPVPFFVSEYEYSGADILKLRFEGYESIEKISEFTGCNIYLTSAPSESDDSDDQGNLIGYSVIINNDNLLGTVTDVIRNTGQWLLVITSPGKKEILIPLHEDFVVRLDDNNKILVLDIPDGLIDLN
jgi:16S rRNA processing protein RimM